MVSVRAFGVMYDHTLFYASISPDQTHATRKVPCQPGYCRWPLNFPQEVCVGMYGLHTDFNTPKGPLWRRVLADYDL